MPQGCLHSVMQAPLPPAALHVPSPQSPRTPNPRQAPTATGRMSLTPLSQATCHPVLGSTAVGARIHSSHHRSPTAMTRKCKEIGFLIRHRGSLPGNPSHTPAEQRPPSMRPSGQWANTRPGWTYHEHRGRNPGVNSDKPFHHQRVLAKPPTHSQVLYHQGHVATVSADRVTGVEGATTSQSCDFSWRQAALLLLLLY